MNKRDILTLIFLIVVCSMLISCERRISDGQAAELAQAREDYRAAKSEMSVTGRYMLMLAAGNRVEAATANLELPPAAVPAAALTGPANEPARNREAHDADDAKAHPPEGAANYSTPILGGSILVLGLAIRLGLLGPLGSIALDLITPTIQRRKREESEKMRAAAVSALDYGHQLTQLVTTSGLKSELSDIQEAANHEQCKNGTNGIIEDLLATVKLKAVREQIKNKEI